MRRDSGFTLIELIAIILVTSIGAIGLSRLSANANVGMVTATNVQVMSQHVQACAERIIATRRDFGFNSANLTTSMCDSAPAGYTRLVSMPATYSGTGVCPTGATCRDVTVTVCANTSITCVGVMKSSVVQLLVLY